MRIWIVVLLSAVAMAALAGSASAAVPSNDEFAGATAIKGEPQGTATTAGATQQTAGGEGQHGGHAAAHSVWFDFEATSTGRAAFSVFSGAFEPQVSVYAGTALDALTPVADSSEFFALEIPEEASGTEIYFDAEANQHFKIAVDTNGGTGAFEYAGEVFEVAPNDAFATPLVLGGDSPQASGDTSFASAEAFEPIHAGDRPFGSLWYSWTAAAGGAMTVATSGNETRLSVYTGSDIGALTVIGENDDVSPQDPSSLVSFEATAGTNYRIAVDTDIANGNIGGPFTLSISHPSPAPPGGGGGSSTSAAPETTITKAPKRLRLKGKAKKVKATLTFGTPSAGASFECSIDHGVFKPCPSTFAVSLKKGRHTIQVRAKNSAGAVDASPASASIKVEAAKAPKPKRHE